MAETSPTPWDVRIDEDCAYIRDAGGNYVLGHDRDGELNFLESSDADLIVRAVNSHAALLAACEPLAHFAVFMEALAEVGELDPLEDHQAVCQVSGGGGSPAITVGMLRAVARALALAEATTS